MSKFVASDGCEIFYKEKGEGQPLIFVHGWSANSDYFDRQMEYFSKEYRVILYDLRGHGRSDKRMEILQRDLTMERNAKDVKELIEHLGLEDVNICGWSMGTSILLCYVKLFGCHKLRTISFIDMTPKLLNEGDWSLGDFDAYDNLAFTQQLATNWQETFKEAIPELFARDMDRNSELYQWVYKNMENNIPYVMATMWLAMALGDYREVLPEIKVPAFLAYSSGGDMYGPEHGMYMRDHIPNAQLVIFENCGHSLYLEDTERFNREYHDFLKK